MFRNTVKKLAKTNRNVLSTRNYHFASTQYNKCFGDWQKLDADNLKKETLNYLEKFDPQLWYNSTQHTILQGKSHDR
eukprot:UN05118